MNNSLGAFALYALTACTWLLILLALTSSHVSTVVGAWLLGHGIEIAKFRRARKATGGEILKKAEEAMRPEPTPESV